MHRNCYGSLFFFLNKKMWYQLKYLIQDLMWLSFHASLITIQEKNNVCLFNGKKLLLFYQKFKKCFKKYITSKTIIIFLISIMKNELVYIEDKIIIIEKEMYNLLQTQNSYFLSSLIFNYLCRYYIYLNNYENKKNWAKQCSFTRKKANLIEKKPIFGRIFFRTIRNFLFNHNHYNWIEKNTDYSPVYSLSTISSEKNKLTTKLRHFF